MHPTTPESKPRFFLLLGMPVLLFGGFVLWGISDRAVQNAPDAVGSPTKLSAERKAIIVKRRKSYSIYKQMAAFGKKGDYDAAARLVTDAFLTRNDSRKLRLLRAEAWFRAGDKRGGEGLREIIRGDSTLNKHEADLLAGEEKAYRDAVTKALRNADANKITPYAVNDLGRRMALIPNATDAAGWQKAVQLCEYAARKTEASRSTQSLMNFGTVYVTSTLGAVYFRAGRVNDAVRVLTESEKMQSDPFNATFLALAYRDLGDKETAKQWRDHLQKYLDDTYATRDGQMYRHQLLLLWREGQESPDRKHN